MTAAITIIIAREEPRVDTRDLAHHLGIQHRSAFKLVEAYPEDFKALGVVRFEIAKPPKGAKGGRPERSALLTEDQAYLLLAYSRNTAKVRALKVDLVKAFRDARAAAETRQRDYLPGYHELHDRVHQLAAESENRHWVHANFDKLVNKTVGLSAGQRQGLPAPVLSLTAVVQTVATRATAGAADHKEAYQRAKAALGRLQDALAVLDGPEVAVLGGGRHHG
ncbi:Rha family transcriptional regulator [Hydrogenophaga atypica]|uniref:Rha family transcriptional regulator n=1 Tax=Hydrogenophaga atypica TaxID=249409 RepID=A0ABW2QRE4_9BURK